MPSHRCSCCGDKCESYDADEYAEELAEGRSDGDRDSADDEDVSCHWEPDYDTCPDCLIAACAVNTVRTNPL